MQRATPRKCEPVHGQRQTQAVTDDFKGRSLTSWLAVAFAWHHRQAPYHTGTHAGLRIPRLSRKVPRSVVRRRKARQAVQAHGVRFAMPLCRQVREARGRWSKVNRLPSHVQGWGFAKGRSGLQCLYARRAEQQGIDDGGLQGGIRVRHASVQAGQSSKGLME